MDASDALGFGTQLALADPATASELLSALVTLAEQGDDRVGPQPLVEVSGDGLSAALIRGETSAALYTFPDLRSVTLQLFTAHDLPLGNATKQFLAAYRVGRFKSSVRSRGLFLPRHTDELRGALCGQRDYARLRIAPEGPIEL